MLSDPLSHQKVLRIAFPVVDFVSQTDAGQQKNNQDIFDVLNTAKYLR